MPDSVASLIEALGGVTAVAQHFGVPVSTVGSWKARERIPDDFRPGVVALAQERNVAGVTYERLTLMHAKPPAGQPIEAATP